MSLVLHGKGVSSGIAIGKAWIPLRDQIEINEYALPAHLIDAEIERFNVAHTQAKHHLESIRQHIPGYASPEINAFIETHLLMLDDAALSIVPVDIIRTRGCNAEWALKQQRDTLISVFEAMDDAYLRTRRDDVEHVVDSIMRHLLSAPGHHIPGPEHSVADHILVAEDLTPADTVLMQHLGIAAFVTESGGPTSHTAILARSLGMPALVSLHHVRRYLRQSDTLILDGQRGVLIATDDSLLIDDYRARQKEYTHRQRHLKHLRKRPAISCDGEPLQLMANIELPEDIETLHEAGADGVGLYRTEYLFMNRDAPPDEDEQFDVYAHLVRQLRGAPLTIRTLDLGADKQVDGGRRDAPIASSPALGLRAIRLCLKEPDLFIPQLRAILRASHHGPVRMMLPMISNLPELLQVHRLIAHTRAGLEQEGIAFDPALPIGGMIEVPAAALCAGLFAKHLDFLSIGTNDLIQYTLAIDRVDDEVNYLYDPLNPAVLKLIHHTLNAGRATHTPVAMCGEMAGDPRFTRLLLGLGLSEFSMHPSMLLEIKYIITHTHIGRLRQRTEQFIQDIEERVITEFIDTINELD